MRLRLLLRTLVLTGLLVPLLVFVPFVQKRLRTWLHPGSITGQLFGLGVRPVDINTSPMRLLIATLLTLSSLGSSAQPGSCDDLVACYTPLLGGGNVVSFNSCTQPGTNTQYVWHFGDGATGSGASPIHMYTAPGTYTACLVAYWNNCVEEFCLPVVVEGGDPCANLLACFETDHLQGNAYLFTNCSSALGDGDFVWHFGDGSSSTSMNADHLFQAPGTYEVCLVAAWGDCTDEVCHSVVVEGGDPCAGFEAGFAFLTSGGGFQFSNTSTGLGDQTTWYWSFGDDTHSDNAQPFHEFPEPGTYTVCLAVTTIHIGPNGAATTCTDDYCAPVTVQGGGECNGLVACFEALPLENGVYLFDNCSTDPIPAQYVWEFGDGGTSTNNSPDHAFLPGTYTVCLTVYWGNCVDETCTTITVGGDPCEGFNACFVTNYLQQPGAFFFDNCTEGQGNAQFVWDFGDGGSSTGTNVDHVYQANGNYTVCLTAYYGNCSDSTCVGVVVSDVGDFCDDLVACFEPQPFENGAYFFSNCSQLLPINIPAYYLWDFGDGSTSDNAQPDHAFAPGTYTVCLTVTHGDCVDSTCTTISVGGGDPCDQLQADFTSTPNGLAVQFISTTAGPSPQSTFSWTFGDGSTGSGPNPIHEYAVQGIYEVCLRVESIYAFPGQPVVTCVDEICYDVDAGFSNACEGLVACFEPLPFENGAYLFENCSQPLDIIIPPSYLWDFGDGTTSDEVQPDHAFAPGIYTVCLTMTQGNCVDEICHTITVISGPGCDPNYASEFTWTAQGTAVVFVATVNLPTVGYIWHFGDGSEEGYGNIITHLYEPPGPYEVCLDAWYWNQATQDTCWAYRCHLVDPFNIVNAVPDIAAADITVFPVPARDMLTVSGLPTSATLRLFAADGRLVLTERATSTTHQVQVAGLASGTYVLRIDAGERGMYRRVAVE